MEIVYTYCLYINGIKQKGRKVQLTEKEAEILNKTLPNYKEWRKDD